MSVCLALDFDVCADASASTGSVASYGRRVPKVVHLVQDHEPCLWNADSIAAAAEQGFTVQKNFPKCSPDLNVVEWFWARLKERLEQRAPVKCETRKAFLVRLRRTVQWMNENLHEEMFADVPLDARPR